MSVVPPAANGTTYLIGFDGHACAVASVETAASVMPAASVIHRFIGSSLWVYACSRTTSRPDQRSMRSARSASMPTDFAASIKSFHVVSSSGTPFARRAARVRRSTSPGPCTGCPGVDGGESFT